MFKSMGVGFGLSGSTTSGHDNKATQVTQAKSTKKSVGVLHDLTCGSHNRDCSGPTLTITAEQKNMGRM